MHTEQDWAEDKRAFIDEEDAWTYRHDRLPLRPLAKQFAGLTKALLEADTVHDVLEQVVVATHRIVPGADLVSVTMRHPDGRLSTPVETDPAATRLDALQYGADHGPCIDATQTPGEGVAVSHHLAEEPNWPIFGPAAAKLGVHAVLSTGILPNTDPPRFGSLNIYSYRPKGLAEADQDVALLLATHAALAVSQAEAHTATRLREAQLQRALDSRDVIGQAKGILMERRGISAHEAFDVLRRSSQHLNIKLADVARTVATRRAEL